MSQRPEGVEMAEAPAWFTKSPLVDTISTAVPDAFELTEPLSVMSKAADNVTLPPPVD